MKLRIALLTVAALALALGFAACSSEIAEETVPQANLLSLSVRTADGKTINVPVIPSPISGSDWNNEDYTLAGARYGTILAREETDTEGARLNARASGGATVAWGTARAGNRPEFFTDPRVAADFTLDDFLYIKVTADDWVTTNYYRFYSIMASPVKELASMGISNREANSLPTAAVTMSTLITGVRADSASSYETINITTGEALRAIIQPVGQEENATFRYVVAQTRTDYPTSLTGNPSALNPTDPDYLDQLDAVEWAFTDTVARTFQDGNILYVEVTAQNEKDKYYYAFRVWSGRIATIDSLRLGTRVGAAIVPVEVVGKGTPMRAWNSVTPGAFSSADQPDSGFTVQIQLTDPDSTYDYQVLAANATEPSDGWTNKTGPALVSTSGQHLIVRVRTARGGPEFNNTETRYYRIPITLLAANIIRQPKSAAYYVESHTLVAAANGRYLFDAAGTVTLDRVIEPLTVELDKTGSFTYQWYESNSWYGGYGFDRDGRISGDPGYGEGLSQADKDLIGSGLALDEKGNVSLHNGGNSYYRLPSAGRQISGATNPTYTPTIGAAQRPFISGFSNQKHYYWVVVTDTSNSRTVTSQCAIIVTEWNQEWNLGKPVGQKFAEPKKHHIVDLYAFTDNPKRTAEGLQGLPKNPTPFIDGNHRDKYAIPIKFLTDFDIMDYTIVTCQAKFYLADGRAWIQNWTQGDFGFEKDGERLVLWYNLTNDNATRGLDKSGNDPISASLNVIPSHVIIQPAGTSPIKQMPPFKPDGQPDKQAIEDQGKTAQGWFTPYIEIVELHFEGPKRVAE